MKSLATPLQLPSSTDAYPGGKVVNKVIILFFSLASPVLARFDNLWRSRCPGPPGLLPSRHQGGAEAKELVPRMFAVHYNST